MNLPSPEFQILSGLVPGVHERIVSLHGSYYYKHWGFGPFFESKVAADLGEFLERYQTGRDGLWTASVDGRVEGSVAIDGSRAHSEGAHLRWFIVSDVLRSRGAGSQLISTAMEFCRDRAYPTVYLWTFAGLDAAKHLYEREGFELIVERQGSQWGTEVLEQKYVYTRGAGGDGAE